MFPKDNLVRFNASAPMSFRAAAKVDDATGETGDGNTIFGHFAVFDTWTEIHSWFEGDFLERIAPGAFADAFKPANRSLLRLMFEHGHDPMIGNKPLGEFTTLREDDTGAYYEGALFDAEYVNQLKPALRAGQLGASFRFSVLDESIHQPEKASSHNPDKLPERTITKVKLYEAGPVVWGAYPEATAGLRSGTDQFVDWCANDPAFVARFIDRVGPSVAARVLTTIAAADGPAKRPDEATDGPGTAKRGRLVATLKTQLATVGGH